MSTIKTLLRLNNRLHAKDKNSGRTDFVSGLFSTAVLGLIATFIIVFFSNLIVNFDRVGAEFELLVFVIFLVLVLQVVFSTILCVRVFFSASQNEQLMKYPISNRTLFFSKLLFIFIRELIFGFALILPLLNIYGAMIGFGASFFIMAPIVALLSTLFTFVLGALLSFPFVFLKMFLSNKFSLMLLVFIALTVLLFWGYMQVINNVVDITNSINFNINSKVIDTVVKISNLVYPATLLTKVLFFESMAASLFIFLGILVLLAGLLVGFEELFYSKMVEANIGNERAYRGRFIRNKQKPTLLSLIRREYLVVFRKAGYLFQYFAFVLIAPLMTYLCVESSSAISYQNIGQAAQLAIAFFVIAVFCVITNSFAATSISREGEGFYLFKIYPLKVKTLILSKVIFACISIFISIVASAITIAVFDLVSFGDAIFLIAAATLISVSQICIAIYIDLKSPHFVDDYDIAKSDKNTTLTILIGLLMAAVVGFISLYTVTSLNALVMEIVVILVSILFAALGVFILFYKLSKNFSNLEGI